MIVLVSGTSGVVINFDPIMIRKTPSMIFNNENTLLRGLADVRELLLKLRSRIIKIPLIISAMARKECM